MESGADKARRRAINIHDYVHHRTYAFMAVNLSCEWCFHRNNLSAVRKSHRPSSISHERQSLLCIKRLMLRAEPLCTEWVQSCCIGLMYGAALHVKGAELQFTFFNNVPIYQRLYMGYRPPQLSDVLYFLYQTY
jgi:hypothetical protein